MANTPLELHIRPANRSDAVAIIFTNLLVTITTLGTVFYQGELISNPNPVDLVFETAAAFAVFALFAATALVHITVTSRRWLLFGLFFFQMGSLLDVADEVVYFDSALWSVAGDAMALFGEITLAVIAFSFVRLSNEIVNRDGLTRLYNQTHHNRMLTQLLKAARQKKTQVAVIAVDIDRFKAVNDTHGHAYGDTVLQHVAGLLTDEAAPAEVVSRTGGEEFEILLPGADPDLAAQRAEDFRATLEANPPDKLASLTASIGVALGNDPAAAGTLRKAADEAAYIAKKSGRNQVRVAGG